MPAAPQTVDEYLARARATDTSGAWLAAGKALSAARSGAAADAAFARAFARAPGHRFVAPGAACHRAGDFPGARDQYLAALSVDPENVDAWRFLALAHSALGDGAAAEKAARHATTLLPAYSRAWHDLGTVLLELDRVADAVPAFRQGVALNDADPHAHAHLANALFVHGDLNEAEAHYRAALARQPDDAASLLGLGHVQKTDGRTADAVASYRACLAARPKSGQAWWSLANLKTHRFTPEDEAAMRALLEDPGVAGIARVNIAYALGKASEDARDFDQAFAYYAEGARLQRPLVRYDPVQTENINARIAKVFSRDVFDARAGQGCNDPAPIFIVGLPRSGSTLIEQILASHPDVDGTSELPIIGRIAQEIGRFRSDGVQYPEAVIDLEPHDLRMLGKQYLSRAARHRGQRPFFTDKMPNNFASIGLISLILPNARIIDARRHPMDSCWGAFKQLFARGQTYSYDLLELGHFYVAYDRLMQHWQTVLPDRVLRVDYEAMVQDQEAQTRRLLAYCGLSFSPACLRFHETARAINTASSEQVRQPLYKDALWAYRRVERHLGELEQQLRPLIDALPAIVKAPPVTSSSPQDAFASQNGQTTSP